MHNLAGSQEEEKARPEVAQPNTILDDLNYIDCDTCLQYVDPNPFQPTSGHHGCAHVATMGLSNMDSQLTAKHPVSTKRVGFVSHRFVSGPCPWLNKVSWFVAATSAPAYTGVQVPAHRIYVMHYILRRFRNKSKRRLNHMLVPEWIPPSILFYDHWIGYSECSLPESLVVGLRTLACYCILDLHFYGEPGIVKTCQSPTPGMNLSTSSTVEYQYHYHLINQCHWRAVIGSTIGCTCAADFLGRGCKSSWPTIQSSATDRRRDAAGETLGFVKYSSDVALRISQKSKLIKWLSMKFVIMLSYISGWSLIQASLRLLAWF